MMKKLFFVLAVALVVATPLYLLVTNLKAEPVKDYAIISPTVKIESYRFARNGDIYQANLASATIISPEGLLLTNSHVVLDERDDAYDVFAICLSFNESEEPVCEYSASLMAYDKNLDLALLKLNTVNNRGGQVPPLPYLSYQFSGELNIGNPLDIYGYPDIGGKTLTRTHGQISGFEVRNGIKYIKTDTDISSGNSGGSALDESSNLIGVPTYLITSYENLGYVLDIKESQQFIETNLAAEPEYNEQAYALLKVKMNLLNDAKDSHHYEHPYYPRFSLTTNEDWEWENIDRTSITLLAESNEGNKRINIEIELLPFAVPQIYLDESARKLSLVSDYLLGYQKEQVKFAGRDATLVTFNFYDKKFYGYIIPYGYAVVNIIYEVDLNKQDEDLARVNQVLNTFAFLENPNSQPYVIETLAKSEPPFSIGRSQEWQILRNQQPEEEDLIAIYHHPENVIGAIKLYYEEIADDEKELNNVEALNRLILGRQSDANFKLINKDSAVIIDNLSGWSLTYSYEGEESQSVREASEVYWRNNDFVYKLVYFDLVENYNKYLPDFKNILRTFKNYNQAGNMVGKGKYEIGSLDYIFSDVMHHRFEQAISNLAHQSVVYGYTDGTFRPEKEIVAAEAKSFISKSLAASKRTNIDQGAVSFLDGMTVTLGDALKALSLTYNLNIWTNKYSDAPDWKPYLDKGYEMGLVPVGLVNQNQSLTRGEFTYILYQLLEHFKAF